MTPPLVCKLLR